jgi:hypothetical protein
VAYLNLQQCLYNNNFTYCCISKPFPTRKTNYLLIVNEGTRGHQLSMIHSILPGLPLSRKYVSNIRFTQLSQVTGLDKQVATQVGVIEEPIITPLCACSVLVDDLYYTSYPGTKVNQFNMRKSTHYLLRTDSRFEQL